MFVNKEGRFFLKNIYIFAVLFVSFILNANTCLQFDGADEYINVGSDSTFNVGNELTVEAWVKANDLSSRYGIFTTRNLANAGAWQLEVGTGNAGSGRIAVSGYMTWVAETGNGTITAGEWYHIAYTRSGTGSGTHKIYVNGSEISLISDDPYEFIDNSSNKMIGSGTSGGQLFPGLLDEIRFWNVARTADEIRENMYLPLTGSETGLVSYWQFNDGTGSSLLDTAGQNNGILYNMEEEDWTGSPVPFGDGAAFTQTIDTTGIFDLTGTGLNLDVTQKTGSDIFVSNMINSQPNILPGGIDNLCDQHYWIIDKFGTGSLETFTEFDAGIDIIQEQEYDPQKFTLWTRPSNSVVDNWTAAAVADSLDSNEDKVYFFITTLDGQYLISYTAEPEIVSLEPGNNSSDVSLYPDLTMIFDKNVSTTNKGEVIIKEYQDDSVAEIIDSGDMTAVLDTVTAVPVNVLKYNTKYYVQIDSLSVIDVYNNYFKGIYGKDEWCFTTEAFLSGFTPQDNSPDVGLYDSLSITFTKDVFAGTGGIGLYLSENDSLIESIPALNGNVTGSAITFGTAAPLLYDKEYYVLADSTAFKDSNEVYFGGIDTADIWNFSTEKFLESAVPADNSTDIERDTDLNMDFAYNVFAGPGNIYLKRSSDDSLIETIPADSCSIVGDTVQVPVDTYLDYNTVYYVMIDPDAFRDENNNYFGGVSDKSVWNFTTHKYFVKRKDILPPISGYMADWGDYDNDGDLDILCLGNSAGVLRNDNGVFTYLDAGLNGTEALFGIWYDHDNDGDLDAFVIGQTGSEICINDNGNFTRTLIAQPAYSLVCYITPSDVNGDGMTDIVSSGLTGQFDLDVLINNGTGFSQVMHEEYSSAHSVSLGDYDNDGDPDLLSSLKVYKNIDGLFIEVPDMLVLDEADYPGACESSWIDYDNDGDLDVVYSGQYASGTFCNIEGEFYYIAEDITREMIDDISIGDYDNDGDSDLIKATGLWSLNSGDFIHIDSGLPDCRWGKKFGDYDNDGDLDVISWYDYGISENTLVNTDDPPSAPPELTVIFDNNGTTLSYGASSDDKTYYKSLFYNAEVTVNGDIRMPSYSNTSGLRRIPDHGNAGQNLFYSTAAFSRPLPQEETKNIVCKVQAIDAGLKGSVFAEADTTFVSEELLTYSNDVMYPESMLSWEKQYPDSIDFYELQIDTDSLFSNPLTDSIPPVVAKDIKGMSIALNGLSFIGSLEQNAIYYWRQKPVYKNPDRITVYPLLNRPKSFLFDPQYYPPSSITIEVSGNFAVISWGSEKEAKGEVYNIYSSDDPYVEFPSGWSLEATVSNTTQWITQIEGLKKFYCVTETSAVKQK